MKHNDFWEGRRVLLTGHTGFKGSWLLLWLQKLNAEVFGYSLKPGPNKNLFELLSDSFSDFLTSRHCVANLLDFQSLKNWVEFVKPDVVFHLAAQPLVRVSYNDPLGTWATNVQGSLNLLEALKVLNHPCAVVMITTDKVY